MSDVQVLHLATLHEKNHNSLYAVRVRVIFVVREGCRLIRAVVKDVESKAGTGPTYELDLLPHGRWQNALQSVHAGSQLYLQCPYLRTSTSTSHSSTRTLHLDDYSSSETPSRLQAVRFLNDQLQPTYSVSFDALPSTRTSYTGDPHAQPMDEHSKELSYLHRKRRRDDERVSVPHSRKNASHIPRSSREGGVTATNGNYKKIAQILDSVDAFIGTRIDVFGVVTDARAACFTRGTGLRSEICIADESCFVPGGGPLKTLQVFTFEDQVKDAIPFRAYGDVVRVRRGLIEQYIDKRTASTTAQLNVKFYATVLVWEYDSDSFQPCLSRKALNKSKEDAVYSLPPEDRKRVHELREWVRNFIHRRFRSPREYVYTIPEVLNRVSMTDESAQTLDMVARVLSISEEGQNLCLKITDGLKQFGPGCQVIDLRSQADEAGMARAKATKFHDFYHCWKTRPSLPAWVLLKDVRVVTSVGKTLYLLKVDRFSSTILFLDDNAPLVRLIKQQYVNIQEGALPANTETAPLERCTDMERIDVPKRIQVRAPCVPDASSSKGTEVCHISRQNRRSSITRDAVKLTQTEPVYDRIPLSKVSEMISDVSSGKEMVHRILVSVVARTCPRNLGHICRPVCRNCDTYVQITCRGDCDEFHCDNCVQTFETRSDSQIYWKVAARLLVSDNSGRAIELWIEGNEGEKFFGCVSGSVLDNNGTYARRMRRIFNAISQPRHVLECCVFGYRYTDKNDVYHVAGKVVGTKLFPRYTGRDQDGTVSEN